ncbi:MAG TPA: TIGR03013 family XrtA/PEP-CTERM system glycosyltransferase [Woeseiaceae bacterium]|nr:TIGR03013 family XrtA/PEP-CTERM system glycosyltransferase [Woeseiaceae bacterium]
MLAELGVMFCAVVAAAGLRSYGDLTAFNLPETPIWPKAAIVIVVLFVAILALGLYQFHQRLYFKDTLARMGVAFLLAGFPLTAVWYSWPELALSRDVAQLAIVMAFAGLTSIRLFFMRTVDENVFRRRTLVYGAGAKSAAIHQIRRRADRRGFRLVGSVSAPGDASIVTSGRLEHNRSLLDIAIEKDAEEIVVAVDERRGNLPVGELLTCKVRGIEVLDLAAFLERETGKVRIDLVTPGWLIFSAGFRITPFRRYAKRGLDLGVGVLALLVALPLMLLSAIAIKLGDGLRAPILYRQRRVGLHGEVFDVLKFRSMIESAEADGEARWAEENDLRITRAGAALRKLRFDELPQIFNVLRGEMSLVGPRPERPEFVSELTKSVPFYDERHTVKPGITGWAQLKYQYGSCEHDAIEKLQYDLYYVKNHSLLLDAVIMLQTAEVILWGKGAR